MRGGLGRRVLTAFLIMTIGPLSVLSWYAARSGRRNIERQVVSKLDTVATATELRLRGWAESRTQVFDVLASGPSLRSSCASLVEGAEDADSARQELYEQLEALLTSDPAFRSVSFVDRSGQPIVSAGASRGSEDLSASLIDLAENESVFHITSLAPDSGSGAVVVRSVTSPSGDPAGTLVGWLALDGMATLLESVGNLGEIGQLYVVDASGMALPQGRAVHSEGIEAAQAGEEVEGSYEDGDGTAVIGV